MVDGAPEVADLAVDLHKHLVQNASATELRMCATRRLRVSAANIGPNRFHQNRTDSWLMSIPRSARRSSTLCNDSGYLTYIITTKRMTSGELLKYRNGLLIAGSYHGERHRGYFV